MIELCAKLDLVDVVMMLSQRFNVSIENVAVQSFTHCYQVSHLDRPLVYPSPRSIPEAILSFPLLIGSDLMCYLQTFPPVGLFRLSMDSFFQKIQPTAEFVLKFFNAETAVSYFATTDRYDFAIDLVTKCQDKRLQKTLFDIVFLVAVQRAQFRRFRHCLTMVNQHRDVFGQHLHELFGDPFINSMGPVRLEIEQFLGLNEEASETAIQLFCERNQSRQALTYLDSAESSITEELHARVRGKRTFKIETDKLQLTLIRIQLQRKFAIFCMENGLDTYGELGFFGSPRLLDDSVFVLLRNLRFDLAFQVMEHFDTDCRGIAERVLDTMFSQGQEQLILFTQRWAVAATRVTYEHFMYPMLRKLFYEIEDKDLTFTLILEVLRPDDFRIRLLIEFGFLEAAAKLAMDEGQADLVAFIAHLAPQSQTPAVLVKCMKWLEARAGVTR
jgi:hypothetical protein